jgi:hypothetical protein
VSGSGWRLARHATKAVDDVLTGLDDGARWLRNEIGVFGLVCLGVSIGMLALIFKSVGG